MIFAHWAVLPKVRIYESNPFFEEDTLPKTVLPLATHGQSSLLVLRGKPAAAHLKEKLQEKLISRLISREAKRLPPPPQRTASLMIEIIKGP